MGFGNYFSLQKSFQDTDYYQYIEYDNLLIYLQVIANSNHNITI
jgi:hypothetical protein